jgi:hypothetical protein
MVTCRFGVRPFVRTNGHPTPKRYEVFDRVTGDPVVCGLSRDEAERDARRRNSDPSGPPGMAVCLTPVQVKTLRNMIAGYRYLVPGDGEGRSILEDLYALFSSWAVLGE